MRMTIGTLARRIGVPVKTLREYEDLGLIYTLGRSPGGYRLFDDEALWCVGVVGRLRDLGLTLTEIRDLAGVYRGQPGEEIGPRMAAVIAVARQRTQERIAELQQRLERIAAFERANAAELDGRASFREHDPSAHEKGLTLPPG